MERHILLAGVRRKEILFPPGFTTEAGREKQVQLYYTTMSYKGIFAMVVSAITDFDSILAIPTTTHEAMIVSVSLCKHGCECVCVCVCVCTCVCVCVCRWR